jgi:Kef-type K+ transport system membrane component KefB
MFLAATGESAQILLSLLIIFFFAKLLAEIFERLRQPAVVGEILAGVLIGPSVLGWVKPNDIISMLAEIGVIFLLFTVGLETKPQAILRVGARAGLVGVCGIVAPFAAGYAIMQLWGGGQIEALFVGAAMVATSVGITARVLGNMGLLDAPTARIILGAAVIDDILGLLILAVVSGVSAGRVDYWQIFTTAVLAVGFTVFVGGVGYRLFNRVMPRVERFYIGDPVFIAALIVCLGLSVAANFIGVAAIIGAFLAGMCLAEVSEQKPKLHKQVTGITEFLVPFFLVNIGMQLNLSVFKDANVIWLTVIITVAAVLTKLFGCGLGSWGLSWKRAGQVGVGMVPRGEVGIVVAQIGMGLAVITDAIFGVVLFMAIATTLIAPPFIKMAYAGEDAANGKIDDDDAGGILPTDETLMPIG